MYWQEMFGGFLIFSCGDSNRYFLSLVERQYFRLVLGRILLFYMSRIFKKGKKAFVCGWMVLTVSEA